MVTDAFVEGPDGVELITSVEAAVAEVVEVDISCDDVGRVDIEDGVTDSVGVNEVCTLSGHTCQSIKEEVWFFDRYIFRINK